MKVSGFSIIRDGERLGYPFIESVLSILPIVDEFVIALGNCTDETPQMLREIESPKLSIFDTVWDDQLVENGQVLAVETNKALERCTGDWCFYLQGDEVIHEDDHEQIVQSMQRYLPQTQVEGLVFRYRHFKGSYDLCDPIGYRKQTRIIRNRPEIVSVGDACGFGVPDMNTKKGYRKLNVRPSGAWVHHYGWVRPPRVMNQKMTEFERLYTGDEGIGIKQAEHQVEEDFHYDVERCVPFNGTHPAVMQQRVEQANWIIPFTHVPRWRNSAYWDGLLRKNFKNFYRRAA